jgi:N-acetylmuramoyl-L-alanine amidase
VAIDTPTAGANVTSGSVTVTGWAIDNISGIGNVIGSVVVKVDGATVGAAAYGSNRSDVCNAYPGRPGCPNVGYSYTLNTGALSTGPHTITVSATDADAPTDTGSASVSINVSNPAGPLVMIDSIASGASLSGMTIISGWAIDSSSPGTPISSVQVKVDGNVVGTATYGIPRSDVCALYSGRAGCPNVGFSYQLNAAALAPGSHTITAAATNSAATPIAGFASLTVTVTSNPPSIAMDAPAPGALIGGGVAVTGWAIDSVNAVGVPIANVIVQVDGAVMGQATYGLVRSDVCTAYPGRPGCPNVGYSFTLDTTNLTSAAHTLTAIATDANGNSGSLSRPIQVGPHPSVFIDSLPPGATVNGIVIVSGWALDNTTAVGTAITAVQVKVDGALLGSASYGLPRSDVCTAYAGRPGCPNVGFSYQLNTSSLTPGPHTITVFATNSDAYPNTGTYSMTVSK